MALPAESRAVPTALCTGVSAAIVFCGVACWGTGVTAFVASPVDPSSLPRQAALDVGERGAGPGDAAATTRKPAVVARSAISCA
ncbi:hypothetical protein [Micromonospora sp. NBC_00421]|uniref:hypothetical protein n=1 Tax=Micromonospora sp. NBC_00421 TaxID=2975976 RepID=UPI003FA52A10